MNITKDQIEKLCEGFDPHSFYSENVTWSGNHIRHAYALGRQHQAKMDGGFITYEDYQQDVSILKSQLRASDAHIADLSERLREANERLALQTLADQAQELDMGYGERK